MLGVWCCSLEKIEDESDSVEGRNPAHSVTSAPEGEGRVRVGIRVKGEGRRKGGGRG